MKKNTTAAISPKDSFNNLRSIIGKGFEIPNTEQYSIVDVIPTGSYYLDNIIGTKGWPKGRIVEVFGADSSGKSTLALLAIAQCQKNNGTAVYLDVENTFDSSWAKKNGVNLEKLLISKPEYGEQVFTIINNLLETNLVDLIVVDSVAAMSSSIELAGSIDDQQVGLHARLMSKGLRMLQSNLMGKKTIIFFIDQVREKIGMSFGPSTITIGGKALRYAASLRLEIKRIEAIRDNRDIVGFATKIIVVKNKLAPPMKSAMLNLYFTNGFDPMNEVVEETLKTGKIVKKGNYFYHDEKVIAHGLKKMKEYLQSNPKFYETLCQEMTK